MYRLMAFIGLMCIIFPTIAQSQEPSLADSVCPITPGEISFSKRSVSLSVDACNHLRTLASQMKQNPSCHVIITGWGSNSMKEQSRSWDRVNNAIEYLTTMGAYRNDFIFVYGQSGREGIVTYRVAMPYEIGPRCGVPTFRNLRRE